MKNKNIILNAAILLFVSVALCFVSVYLSRIATDYDLGQLAYLFMMFFPLTAMLVGVVANATAAKAWLAPIVSLLVFAAAMLIMFRTANAVYLLAYMVLSLVGYFIAYIIRRIIKR